MDLAKELISWRRKKDLTQEAAAKKIGVSTYSYRNWEYKHRTPSTLSRRALLAVIRPAKKKSKAK